MLSLGAISTADITTTPTSTTAKAVTTTADTTTTSTIAVTTQQDVWSRTHGYDCYVYIDHDTNNDAGMGECNWFRCMQRC